MLNLVFALVTHPSLFEGSLTADQPSAAAPAPSVRTSAVVLAGATALIAWMSEILVGAIEPTARELGLSNAFVGVFVVAILGNAAEHATAIGAALKDRMDLSLSIAIGSSVQVALFVAPALVLASLLIGPATLDLAFPAGLVLVVFLAVLIAGQVAGDGRSDWLKGAQLLAVYLMIKYANVKVTMRPSRLSRSHSLPSNMPRDAQRVGSGESHAGPFADLRGAHAHR